MVRVEFTSTDQIHVENKLIVVSDPKNCDTENNLGAQVGKLVDVEAEVLTAAALNATASGSMAEMLIKSNLKNK
jgi:hypothetical protein